MNKNKSSFVQVQPLKRDLRRPMPPGVSCNCHKTVILFICPWCKTIDLSCSSWFSKNVLQRKSRWLPAGAVGSFLWPPAPPTAGRCSLVLGCNASGRSLIFCGELQNGCPRPILLVLAKIKPVEAVPHGALLPVFFYTNVFFQHPADLPGKVSFSFFCHFFNLAY